MVTKYSKELSEKYRELSSKINYGSQIIYSGTIESESLFSSMPPLSQEICKSMSSFYEPQISGAYCGIASATIVLKYLFMENPEKHANFTQSQIFGTQIKGKLWKTKKDEYYGLDLDQIRETIEGAGEGNLLVKKVQVENEDILKFSNKFKEDLKMAFLPISTNERHAIIINFYREFKDHKGGHFCPIGGFSLLKGTEYVYILDVAAHRVKPHWFPVNQLIPLMCRFDGKSPRGYLIISKTISAIATKLI